MVLQLRFSARSHVGMVRKGNEDSGYGSAHLLVIADGMGGHAAGEVASATALKGVLEMFDNGIPKGAPETADAPDTFPPETVLRAAVTRAGERLRELIIDKPELEGMGTTLTALLQIGDRVAIAQVGDSRGYLLRNGVLEQVTHDQTFVQSLVDQGRISHDDARIHPQRSLLLQAIDGRVEVEPDMTVRSPRVGDRYLLCSDGLSGVLAEATMRELLMVGTPDQAADQLVGLALRGGAPDNVTCVVADVVETDDDGADDESAAPAELVGAAAEAEQANGSLAPDKVLPAGSGLDDHEPTPQRGFRLLLPIVVLLVLVAVAGFFGYRWTQTQYYVGDDSGHVAIFRGVPQHLVGRSLSHVVEPSEMQVADLPTFLRDEVTATISAGSLHQARTILDRLRTQAASCQLLATAPGCTGTPPSQTTTTPSTATSPSTSTSATPTPSVSKR